MILPITLSPEEYEDMIRALAQRDPLIAGLMRKQSEAQQAEAQQAEAQAINGQVRKQAKAEHAAKRKATEPPSEENT
jgi:hypothetical protein